VQEFHEAVKADTPLDMARRAELVGNMRQDDVERLVDQLNARPIINRNVSF
jgi:hypothetical protein